MLDPLRKMSSIIWNTNIQIQRQRHDKFQEQCDCDYVYRLKCSLAHDTRHLLLSLTFNPLCCGFVIAIKTTLVRLAEGQKCCGSPRNFNQSVGLRKSNQIYQIDIINVSCIETLNACSGRVWPQSVFIVGKLWQQTKIPKYKNTKIQKYKKKQNTSSRAHIGLK